MADAAIDSMAENKGHRWQKGVSGNPNGRPKATLEQKHLKPYQAAWPEIAAQRIEHAKKGCCHCIDRVEERLFGKVSQPIDVTEGARAIAEQLGLADDPAAVERIARAGGLRLVK